MSSADTNQVGAAGEGAGLDPRDAATILEQTNRQARRQFDPQSVLAAVVGAGVFLFGYGAVWWSMHDQRVYSGPARLVACGAVRAHRPLGDRRLGGL